MLRELTSDWVAALPMARPSYCFHGSVVTGAGEAWNISTRTAVQAIRQLVIALQAPESRPSVASFETREPR